MNPTRPNRFPRDQAAQVRLSPPLVKSLLEDAAPEDADEWIRERATEIVGTSTNQITIRPTWKPIRRPTMKFAKRRFGTLPRNTWRRGARHSHPHYPRGACSRKKNRICTTLRGKNAKKRNRECHIKSLSDWCLQTTSNGLSSVHLLAGTIQLNHHHEE